MTVKEAVEAILDGKIGSFPITAQRIPQPREK